MPEGVGELWAPPEWFDDEQRAQWHYAMENAPRGVLTATDRECLVTFCLAAAARAHAWREVKRVGMVVKGVNGGQPYQNPFLSIANRQALIMLRTGAEMGFSPAARMALGNPPGGEGAAYIGGRAIKSDFDDYLDRKPDKLQ